MKKLINANGGRDTTSDIISGFCILYMIYGHISFMTNLLGNFLLEWPGYILFCYMPWFFFKSGMYYKGAVPIQTIRKGVRRLLIPYLVFTLLGCGVIALFSLLKGDFNFTIMIKNTILHILQQESADGNNALWFLMVLFIVNVVLSLSNARKINYVIWLSSIVMASLTPLFDCNPWRWMNVLPAMVFVFSGFILNKNHWMQHRVTFWLAIVCFLTIRIFSPSYVEFYPNVLYRGNYTLWILSALSMIVILYRGVEYFKDSIYLKPFAIIGRNTMTLYVCHWPLLLVVKMVADTFHLTPIHTLILMSLTCVVFLSFCQYCIKRFHWEIIIGETKNN